MAKFLFVSYDGLIADIAWECVKEGEDVRFWIKDPEEKEIADGFVPKERGLEAVVRRVKASVQELRR